MAVDPNLYANLLSTAVMPLKQFPLIALGNAF